MNKLLAILEAADEMNMMKKALPICKDRWEVLSLLSNIFCAIYLFPSAAPGRQT